MINVHDINLDTVTEAAERIATKAKANATLPDSVLVRIDPEDAYDIYAYLLRLKAEREASGG